MRLEERIREILEVVFTGADNDQGIPSCLIDGCDGKECIEALQPLLEDCATEFILAAIKDEGVEAWVAGYEAGREAERKYYDALCSFCDSPMSFKVCDECYLGET